MPKTKHQPAGNTNKSMPTALIISIALASGILIGVSAYSLLHGHSDHDCLTNFKLIKPTLDCSVSDEKMEAMSNLQAKLDDMVAGYTKKGDADKIGVFVRDLRSTRFAGVNDADTFIMASLLKTPLVIAAYKFAEVEPKALDQPILYTGSPNLYGEQSFKVKDELVPNRSYTIRELMRRTIVYSDNTAAELLARALPSGFLDRILRALGIQIRLADGNDENLTTPRTYANLFRLLYNASYLTREYSDAALETLTETEYARGATAKIPKSVRIAHKFAERTATDPKTGEAILRQLHECGLVYAEDGKMPYTFCIMTQGKDFEKLETIQREISASIYESMANELD